MWSSDPTWGSKRIQAERATLGIQVSDSTIRKYRPRTRRGDQTWSTFLNNHAKELIAVDFFAVPTATFRVLYVFIILAHEHRKVLHFNITYSQSAAWTAQQLSKAFPYSTPPCYLLRDRDAIYGLKFMRRTFALGWNQKRIVPRSPWQNPFVERLVGSIRRECLDHVIAQPASFARRLTDYISYYHPHRTHRSLDQECAEPPHQGDIIAPPLLSGLRHRYTRQAAAWGAVFSTPFRVPARNAFSYSSIRRL